MGEAEGAGVRAGGAASGDGAEGVDRGSRAPRFVGTNTWVPGSSLRVLPDESVVRWVTNEGVLLDYAIRLRGAVDEIRRHKGAIPDEFVYDDRDAGFDDWIVHVLDKWGV